MSQSKRENKASIKPVLSHINQSAEKGTGAQTRPPVDFINGRSTRRARCPHTLTDERKGNNSSVQGAGIRVGRTQRGFFLTGKCQGGRKILRKRRSNSGKRSVHWQLIRTGHSDYYLCNVAITNLIYSLLMSKVMKIILMYLPW